jgi:predicted Zn-dependent protease
MRSVLVAAVLAVLSACADPLARSDAPEHLALVQEFGGAYGSRSVEDYVQRVGERVADAAGAPGRFRFTVLDDETPNALSLPSGYIYVTRGLLALANSEAELAGVLAHEIAHVTSGHAVERMRQAIADGMALAVLESAGVDPAIAESAALQAIARQQHYSRDQEYAADAAALRILRTAGYDPRALHGFLRTLVAQDRLQTVIEGRGGEADEGEPDFLSSHPRTIDRVERVAAAANAMPGGRIGHDEHLRVVNGLVYGDDPAKGVVRGNRFLHPALGFTFAVPKGFTIVNEDDTVLAIHPSGALILFDADAAPADIAMTRYLEQGWLAGVDLYGVSSSTVGGMPAAMASVRIHSNLGPMRGRVVAVRFDDDTVYRFLLATPADAGPAMARTQADAAGTFRRLSPAEAANIRPYRLRTVKVPPGTVVEQLAAGVPGDAAAERLRVLNGVGPGEALPGGLAKIYTD